MNTRFRFFLGALFFLLASPLAAQSNSEAEIKKAKALFEEAQVLYQEEQYGQALEKYREAYDLSRAPTILFNMGQCYRLLGQLKEAAEYYRRYLEESPDTPYREEIEEKIGILELQIGKESAEAESEALRAQMAELEARLEASVEKDPFAEQKSLLSGVLFGAAGGAGLAGAVVGGIALRSTLEAKRLKESEEGDPVQNNIDAHKALKRAKTLGLVSDALLVTAIATGVGGYVFRKKTKKVEASVTLLPSGVLFALGY